MAGYCSICGGLLPDENDQHRGIDGRLYFDERKSYKSMVLSVKGGHVRPTDIRDLRGVLEREVDAVLAGFISIKEPTKAMRHEAGMAGHGKLWRWQLSQNTDDHRCRNPGSKADIPSPRSHDIQGRQQAGSAHSHTVNPITYENNHPSSPGDPDYAPCRLVAGLVGIRRGFLDSGGAAGFRWGFCVLPGGSRSGQEGPGMEMTY